MVLVTPRWRKQVEGKAVLLLVHRRRMIQTMALPTRNPKRKDPPVFCVSVWLDLEKLRLYRYILNLLSNPVDRMCMLTTSLITLVEALKRHELSDPGIIWAPSSVISYAYNTKAENWHLSEVDLSHLDLDEK